MSQAGVWPITFTAEGIDTVKAAVEGLQKDLNAYATVGDQFAASLGKGFASVNKGAAGGALADAFASGKRAALEFKPLPKEIGEINARLKQTIDAIGEAYKQGGLTGKSALEAVATATAGNLRAARAAGEEVGRQQREAAEATRKHAEAQRTLGTAFASASGFLMGWVRAGMQGTAESARLGIYMQLVSREVANLFVPAIHAAVNALERVYGWFRSLGPEQQKAIGHWALMTVGALGLATVLPRIIASFNALSAVMKAFMTTNPFLLALQGLTLLLLGTEQGRSAFAGLGRSILGLFGELARALQPLVDTLARLAAELGTGLAPIIARLAQLVSWLTERLRDLGALGAPQDEHQRRVERVARGEMTPEQARAEERTFLERFGHGLDEIFGTVEHSGADRFRQEAAALNRGRAGRQELSPAGGPFEAITALYQRLTSAAARTDFDRRSAEANEATAVSTAATANAVHELANAVREGRPMNNMPAVPGA